MSSESLRSDSSIRSPGSTFRTVAPQGAERAPCKTRKSAGCVWRIGDSDLPQLGNLWASWCSPCREEAPLLEAWWRRWGKRGVLFMGLDIQDVRSEARAFLHEERVTYPTIRDPGKGVAHDYGGTGIPETYFLSAGGRVVAHVIGVVSRRQLEVDTAAAREGRVAGRERGGAIRKAR
jgi:thiol-disulfide isomerase/thioredoxin